MATIVFETDNLLFLNKMHGISSVSDLTHTGSELDSINKLLKLTAHPIHRIDKPASGLIVFAKNVKAMRYYSKLLRENQIQRTYLAITKIGQTQESGTLTHFLKHSKKHNKTSVVNAPEEGFKKSVLKFQILEKLDRYMLWRIQLETGRTHQIRAQLAHIGFPIRGDVKYGARRSIESRAILLHSFLWTLPGSEETGESLSVKALPVNFDLWHRFEFIKALKMQ